MSNATYPNPGVKWGLIAGAVGIIAGVILYNIDVPMLFSLKFGFLTLFMNSIFGVLAGLERKRQQGGFIGIKGGLQPVFTTFVIASLLTTVFNYILANYIDTTIPAQIKQATLESFMATKHFAQAIGSTQQEFEKGVEDIKSHDFTVTFASSFIGYLIGLFQCFVVSVILALIIRKPKKA